MSLQTIINRIMGIRFDDDETIAKITIFHCGCQYQEQCRFYNPKVYNCNLVDGDRRCYRPKELEVV